MLSGSLASLKVVDTRGVNRTAEFEPRSVPSMTVSNYLGRPPGAIRSAPLVDSFVPAGGGFGPCQENKPACQLEPLATVNHAHTDASKPGQGGALGDTERWPHRTK